MILVRILIFLAWGCFLSPDSARAHLGSPNVFFEGQAGAYPLRVVIRPPPVLPGIAQVDVRVSASNITQVRLQAALFEAGREAAPDAISASPVPGQSNLFSGALWLLRDGSYSIRVTLEASQGSGSVEIPLNSGATRLPKMSGWLVVALITLGSLLFLSAALITGAAARDSQLKPDMLPSSADCARARRVSWLTVVLLAGALYAGKSRWQKMDQEFRNNALAQARPILALTRTNGNLRLLQIKPLQDLSGPSNWETLVTDHGKLMHLFLLRDPDLNAFAHLHPVRRDSRTFENVLPPLPAGNYQLYAEITRENGWTETLISKIALSPASAAAPQLLFNSNMLNEVFCQSPVSPSTNASEPFALDSDDSWHISPAALGPARSGPQTSLLMGGAKMVFENAGELLENCETSLTFAVFTAQGRPVTLEPYMGMFGHAVVRRSDGAVFTHLHPLGTISMAAQQLFARRELPPGAIARPNSPINVQSADGHPHAPNQVSFPYAFPRAGDYRLWVQVRVDKKVLTGVFDIAVKPGNAASR